MKLYWWQDGAAVTTLAGAAVSVGAGLTLLLAAPHVPQAFGISLVAGGVGALLGNVPRVMANMLRR